MTTDEVRTKFIKFFSSGDRDHKEIPASPLVIENDSTTLFTSAGMQPLIPFLMGEPHPMGKRLVNSQPCIRTQDIDEVGDTSHTTFFEMLGNWSLGDYFKKEQLPWFWEFLTSELNLPKERLWITVFAGDSKVPKDTESFEIWKGLGVPTERISFQKENWWSRAGLPNKMPPGEIGGPDSEVFFEFVDVVDPKFGKDFHPDSKRFLEIGNSVFLEYQKTKNGLEELPQKNVDFGGGLERLAAATNNNPDIFQIDIFRPLIYLIEQESGKKYGENESDTKAMRIITDHVRTSSMIIANGVLPSNKQQGYVLRKLLRRAEVQMKFLKNNFGEHIQAKFGTAIMDSYKNSNNSELSDKQDVVYKTIEEEIFKFGKTFLNGLKLLDKAKKIDEKIVFDLYQSYGFPFEVTLDILSKRGIKVDKKRINELIQEHKQKSRTASAGVFKGGLADHSQEVTQLHTATHLLHAALRKVLGSHVSQKGSNITSERLRFDFTHPKALTPEEIKKVEDLVNEQIDKNLPVSFEVMSLDQAKKEGALAFFGNKYSKQVKVYSIDNFSKEVCGGPHVKNLSEISGHVRIIKEQAVSAGVRRIYARISGI